MILYDTPPLAPAEITWKGGVPYSVVYNDYYFSKASGLAESTYVFLEANNLPERFQKLSHAYFVIGEVGFGCGRNFLLTLDCFLKNAPSGSVLQYFSFEKHPLRIADLKKMFSLWPTLFGADQLLYQYPTLTPGLHHLTFAKGRIKLYLYFSDALTAIDQFILTGDSILESAVRGKFFDAWYLDGFSPHHNQEAWSHDLLLRLACLSIKHTTFSSYSASGEVRRALSAVGFDVKKKPGFSGKREMIFGTFNERVSYIKKSTPWYWLAPPSHQEKSAIVLGAGLAGCCMANQLAQRGFKVTLIEKNNVLAGVSGYQRALLFPGFFTQTTALACFMQTAYLFSQKKLDEFAFGNDIVRKTSLLYARTKKSHHQHTFLAKLLDAHQASIASGVQLSESAWQFDSAIVNIPKLCEELISHPLITTSFTTHIQALDYDNQLWRVAGYSAPLLIMTMGFDTTQIKQGNYLSLNPVKGQVSFIQENFSSLALKLPLCGEGHILPAIHGTHALGATYEPGVVSMASSKEADFKNWRLTQKIKTGIAWSEEVVGAWSGIRTVTSDYFPCMGPIANAERFYEQYHDFKTDKNRFINQPPMSYPGLYVLSGLGSKGLTSVFILADALAEELNGGMLYLEKKFLRHLSPNRFLYRALSRGVS